MCGVGSGRKPRQIHTTMNSTVIMAITAIMMQMSIAPMAATTTIIMT